MIQSGQLLTRSLFVCADHWLLFRVKAYRVWVEYCLIFWIDCIGIHPNFEATDVPYVAMLSIRSQWIIVHVPDILDSLRSTCGTCAHLSLRMPKVGRLLTKRHFAMVTRIDVCKHLNTLMYELLHILLHILH